MKINRQLSHLLILEAAAVLVCSAGFGLPAQAKDNPIRLTYAFFAPAVTFPGKQMAQWASEIEKRTNGSVKVETFPYTRYGMLRGAVSYISPDAVAHEELGYVYAMRVRIEDVDLSDGGTLPLAPGMAVTVEIKTGHRRLIDYLLSPLLRYRQESLRER